MGHDQVRAGQICEGQVRETTEVLHGTALGSRLWRESTHWFRQQAFSDHVAAGRTLATLFG